jgi:uncharacterized protein YjiS (DUF1127 family)
MSTFTLELMINNHGRGVLAQLAETLHVWRHRYEARRELARWSDRELHDIGLSPGDAIYEASKPFWQT